MTPSDPEVDSILDGWFGEPLAHSENEDQLRKHLYDPLRELLKRTRKEAYLQALNDADVDTSFVEFDERGKPWLWGIDRFV